MLFAFNAFSVASVWLCARGAPTLGGSLCGDAYLNAGEDEWGRRRYLTANVHLCEKEPCGHAFIASISVAFMA
jgi:hypothetical protein